MRSGISFTLSAPDRLRLDVRVADRNTPQKHVWRARIVLPSADGLHAIMREAGVFKAAVWRWQERFAQEGVDGYSLPLPWVVASWGSRFPSGTPARNGLP